MECRNRLVNDYMSAVYEMVDNDTLKDLKDQLILVLANYDIAPKCTELATVDTESEMMLKKFLATKRTEGRSEKTVERYRYIITRFYEEMRIPYSDVDVFALRLYLAQLEQGGNSGNTVNGIRSILCSFFGWLNAEGLLQTNPAANLSPVKCRKVIRKPYSNVELEIIKANCETLRDRALVEFLLSTGCRIEETVNLNIADIDFYRQECKVLGKGNKERVVFINDVCALHLRKYINSRTDHNEALFIGKGDVRILPGGIRAMLKRIEMKSGVENIHPHRFRRTLATSLIDKGMAIQDVAAILGHANVNTTMTYIYTDTANVRNAYKKLVS